MWTSQTGCLGGILAPGPTMEMTGTLFRGAMESSTGQSLEQVLFLTLSGMQAAPSFATVSGFGLARPEG